MGLRLDDVLPSYVECDCVDGEVLGGGESKRWLVPRKFEASSEDGQSSPKSIAEWNDSQIDDSGL